MDNNNLNIRGEVKFRGGRFVPYGKDLPSDLTPIEGARYYIEHISRADYVYMPWIVPGTKGHAGSGRVYVAKYTKQQVLNALDKLAKGEARALRIVEGQVKLMGISRSYMLPTFGEPTVKWATSYTKAEDIEPDPNCENAPYARAWEKICATACGGQWVGALKGVQVDIIINPLDD